MIRTYGLTHIALAVRDAAKSFAFYEKVFGAVAVYQQEGFIQAQTPGSRDVIVFEKSKHDVGLSAGVAHFGFRLTDPADVDEAARLVEEAGGRVVEKGDFCPGEPYLFAHDIDGYTIEIWYEIPTSADPKNADTVTMSQRS